MSARHKRPTRATTPHDDMPPGMLGVPCVDWMWSQAALSFLKLSHTLPGRSQVYTTFAQSSSIARQRNSIVRAFLRTPRLQWVAMVDSDMVAPPDTIRRLLATGKDVVGALCFGRQWPHAVAARTTPDGIVTDRDLRKLRPAETVGTGCILIRRHVLEAIPDPWFQHTAPGVGEDAVFCLRAREAGFQVWLDGTTEVGHLGVTNVTSEYAAGWMQTAKAREYLAQSPEALAAFDARAGDGPQFFEIGALRGPIEWPPAEGAE